MKRLFSIILLFSIALTATAQLSERLEKEITNNPNQLYSIAIAFPRYVDLTQLQAEWNKAAIPQETRQRALNRVLMTEARTRQENAISILNDPSIGETKSYWSFYAVNRIIAVADKNIISELSKLPEIQLIDLAAGDLIFDEPIIEENPTETPEAVGSPEPGLIAINAPAMWDLGYTGRGRKVYIYDTGVWPTHPAFSHRFLGHFNEMDAAWYGHFADEPNGAISDHGTHVLGTTAGLDTATHDTIGVAFGSYWMACDLINGSTAAGLPDQVYLIGAFEWALNPDGDTATTDDIPDVINNSWRWRDIIDTAECNGFIPQLMTTIEAAGIANIFSGGNTGPTNVGVNSPQRINTSEVNTFTVGSVNANTSFPYPISSFSTRGPTQCAGTGSLKIHPEVSAPGQNVRSAWGTDSYNSISGTSMASPHVSGAVLLLKEAFPYLTGSQLLQALYDSAIDLGAVGEDNTFGKGLIDVYAAYQLLAQTHTPVSPDNIKYDVAIRDVSLPNLNDITCDSLYNPVITLVNLGDSAISSVELYVFQDGVQVFSAASVSTPGLNTKGDEIIMNTTFQFPIANGDHVWSVKVISNKNEFDVVNNERFVRFKKIKTSNLPILEDFENGIDSTIWLIKNSDYNKTWDTTAVLGWPGNNTAMHVNLSEYTPVTNQKDELWSVKTVIPSTVTSVGLGFHVAYKSRGTIPALQDTMRVFISDDCGKTFPYTVYEKDGAALATVSQTGKYFVPQDSTEWRRENIDLSAFIGKDVVVKFETTNRNGNSIYLDNISIYEGNFDPFKIKENQVTKIKIYPNPTYDMLTIEVPNADLIGTKIAVLDTRGTIVGQFKTETLQTKINVTNLAKGVYILTFGDSDFVERIRFVKF